MKVLLPRSLSIPVRNVAENLTFFKIKTYTKINRNSGNWQKEMASYKSQASSDLTSPCQSLQTCTPLYYGEKAAVLPVTCPRRALQT